MKTVRYKQRYKIWLENGLKIMKNGWKMMENSQKWLKIVENGLKNERQVSETSVGVWERVQVLVDGRQELRMRENTW